MLALKISACRPPTRHTPSCSVMTVSTASANVGITVGFTLGSPPSSTIRALAIARSCASASDTRGNDPKPRLTGLPPIRNLWLQILPVRPFDWYRTQRDSPCPPLPSPYRPGCEIVLTNAADSVFGRVPPLSIYHTVYHLPGDNRQYTVKRRGTLIRSTTERKRLGALLSGILRSTVKLQNGGIHPPFPTSNEV